MIADGVSSSPVGHLASRVAVSGFLDEYRCAPGHWGVLPACRIAVKLVNGDLYARTIKRIGEGDPDRGFVCTVSALVITQGEAHVAHVGDSQVTHIRGDTIQVLTRSHRETTSAGERRLNRALGTGADVEIDTTSLTVQRGDLFVLSTDGVHDHLDGADMHTLIADHADDLDSAAEAVIELARQRGSSDDATVQIVGVDICLICLICLICQSALRLRREPSCPWPIRQWRRRWLMAIG